MFGQERRPILMAWYDRKFETIALICLEYLHDGFGRDCARDRTPSTNIDL
jgi:hypothetical protein